MKIRNDKDWSEAMTMQDLNQMITDYGNNQRLYNRKKRKFDDIYQSGSEGANSDDDLA